MVLNKIKNLITGADTSELQNYQAILDNLSLDINNPNHKVDIDLIKKAFDIGYTAHKGQLRKSGEEYFSHCIEVGIQLSKWNMDRDVVISGLLLLIASVTSLLIQERKYSVRYQPSNFAPSSASG